MSDFHMVVCVKAVPGSTEVKMDPKTNTIVRDGKQAVINPFDASALECALALKDDFIGFGMDVRVTVVSMGIPATESLLRDCIARGSDDALLLTDRAFAGADTLATTYALKCGIEALDEDTLDTINRFFENNLNVSETSRKLFVHRNTLVYRLEKIKKLTGLDLREFEDAIVFKVALMVKKYLNASPTKY